MLCRPMAFDRWKILPRLRQDSKWNMFHSLPKRNNENVDWFFPAKDDHDFDDLLIEVTGENFPFQELRVKREILKTNLIEMKKGGTAIKEISARMPRGIKWRHDLSNFIKPQEHQTEIKLNFISKEDMQEFLEPKDSEKSLSWRTYRMEYITNYCVSVVHSKTGRTLVRNIVPFGANEKTRIEGEEHYFTELDFGHVLVQPLAIWEEGELYPTTLISKDAIIKERNSIVELFRGFDDGVKDFTVTSSISERRRIYLKHAGFAKSIPLDCFGDGMKRAFVLIASAAAARDGILLIDEIETGLHYSAMLRTMTALILATRAFNVQIFLTTHSLEAIDAFLDAARETNSLDEIVGFSLNEVKTKQPKRFDGRTMQRMRFERGFELR